MRAFLNVLIAALASCCAACASADAQVADAPACRIGEAMVETQLFFGLTKPGGGRLNAAQWDAFVRKEVVPRLPEGFTVLDGAGYWLSGETKRTISEHSKVIVRLHAPDAAADASIDAIAKAYKKRFAQDSVLRVDKPACARF